MKNVSLALGFAFVVAGCGVQTQRSVLAEDKKPKEWYEELKAKKNNEKELETTVKNFTSAMLEGVNSSKEVAGETTTESSAWVGKMDDGKDCTIYFSKSSETAKKDKFSLRLYVNTKEKGKVTYSKYLAGVWVTTDSFESFRDDSTKENKSYTLATTIQTNFDENGKSDFKKMLSRLYAVNLQVADKGERTVRVYGNNIDSKYQSYTCKGLKFDPEVEK